jgi:hypothetical protein
MATAEVVSILNPVSEEAERRKADAKKHWGTITKAGGLVSVNSLRIGFHAAILKREGMFGILGFENEKHAQEASGVGDSTWFAMIRLAEQFNGVSEDLFCGMRQANAKALANLPESKRLTEYWLRRAATDSMDTFAALIDTELDGKARESDGKERTVSFAVKMSKSQKKVIDTGLQEISKELGCEGNEAKTLELMVAERKESPSLIGVMTSAINRIAAIKQLGDSGISAAEALEKAYAGLDEIVIEFRSALESLQNGQSEV